MGSLSLATALGIILELVQAGLVFETIVQQVQAMEASGATPEAVSAYLKGLRDAAIGDLKKDAGVQ